jgi:hypothetical protein
MELVTHRILTDDELIYLSLASEKKERSAQNEALLKAR